MFDGLQPSALISCDGMAVMEGAGALGPVTVNDHELIRRLFVTVRDAEWREIIPTSWRVTPTGNRAVAIDARHQTNEIDFRWSGQLRINAKQSVLDFRVHGVAAQAMSVCRIGLVVLLPPQLLDGGRVHQLGADRDGTVALRHAVEPQTIVGGLPKGIGIPFDRIYVEGISGARLKFSFEGDLFELEDQRNWGDASYKIYCTPLSVGFPREVACDSTIDHRVVVEWSGIAPGGDEPATTIIYGETPGIELGVHGAEHSPLVLDFRTIKIGKGNPLARGSLQRWCESRLHIAVSEEDLDEFAAAISELRHSAEFRLARVQVIGAGGCPPTHQALSFCRSMLDTAGLPGVEVWAAVGGFVEWNRGGDLPQSISFPFSPTTHHTDLATAFENVSALRPMVERLRALRPECDVAIAPLAWSLNNPGPSMPSPGQAFVWLAGMLLEAANAGVGSVAIDVRLISHIADTESGSAELRRLVERISCAGVSLVCAPADVSLRLIPDDRNFGTIIGVNFGNRPRTVILPRPWIAAGELQEISLPPAALVCVPVRAACDRKSVA